jgi:hypothetical protein
MRADEQVCQAGGHCLSIRISSLTQQLVSTDHEKISARNVLHAHAQDFAMSDELLLAILKVFVPQVNKQQTVGFNMFAYN